MFANPLRHTLFFFRLTKDCATVLTKQFPRRLTLGSRCLVRQRRHQSLLPHFRIQPAIARPLVKDVLRETKSRTGVPADNASSDVLIGAPSRGHEIERPVVVTWIFQLQRVVVVVVVIRLRPLPLRWLPISAPIWQIPPTQKSQDFSIKTAEDRDGYLASFIKENHHYYHRIH